MRRGIQEQVEISEDEDEEEDRNKKGVASSLFQKFYLVYTFFL